MNVSSEKANGAHHASTLTDALQGNELKIFQCCHNRLERVVWFGSVEINNTSATECLKNEPMDTPLRSHINKLKDIAWKTLILDSNDKYAWDYLATYLYSHPDDLKLYLQLQALAEDHPVIGLTPNLVRRCLNLKADVLTTLLARGFSPITLAQLYPRQPALGCTPLERVCDAKTMANRYEAEQKCVRSLKPESLIETLLHEVKTLKKIFLQTLSYINLTAEQYACEKPKFQLALEHQLSAIRSLSFTIKNNPGTRKLQDANPDLCFLLQSFLLNELEQKLDVFCSNLNNKGTSECLEFVKNIIDTAERMLHQTNGNNSQRRKPFGSRSQQSAPSALDQRLTRGFRKTEWPQASTPKSVLLKKTSSQPKQKGQHKVNFSQHRDQVNIPNRQELLLINKDIWWSSQELKQTQNDYENERKKQKVISQISRWFL